VYTILYGSINGINSHITIWACMKINYIGRTIRPKLVNMVDPISPKTWAKIKIEKIINNLRCNLDFNKSFNYLYFKFNLN